MPVENIFSVIFMNFWGYDLIIFIAAVITGLIYFSLRKSADRLYDKMHLTVFVPDGDLSRLEADKDISGLRETEVVKMRNNMGKSYSIFVNLTGIFPLLGILGTVVSLLGLVSDTSDVTGNFYGALTSTFWGLVFAIAFKFLDGIISAKIEDNEKNVALFLERNNTFNKHTSLAVRKSQASEMHISHKTDNSLADSSDPEPERDIANERSDSFHHESTSTELEVMNILNSINQ